MPSASVGLDKLMRDLQISKKNDVQEVEPLVDQADNDDQLSHNSASTDDDACFKGKKLVTILTDSIADLSLTMMSLLQCKEGQAKYFDIESKAGLTGSQTCWSFPCIYD